MSEPKKQEKTKILALKVDIDTQRGYEEGTPRLLELFISLGIKGTFFFSMGPDNSGQALVRVLRPGFLSKMMRTKAVSTYGFKTMLYGTFLPAPMIIDSSPWVLKLVSARGQECGVHAWDHVKWQDRLEKLPATTLEADFKKAFGQFYQRTGHRAKAVAAPGWQVSQMSLRVQDELCLDYASDTRGQFPFLPKLGHKIFSTPQIPTTMPTMDEILGKDGLSGSKLVNYLTASLKEGLNVYTLHAEMEGMGELETFRDFLHEAMGGGVKFMTLSSVAAALDTSELKVCEVSMRQAQGRAGKVASQVLF